MVAACLDIEKAYYNTDITLLCRKLSDLGLNTHIIDWLKVYLSDRTLVLGNCHLRSNRGLAQGSTLSPTLFNIFTAGLHEIASDNCMVFQFADDFFIVCKDKDFSTAQSLLIEKLQLFDSMCKDLRLSFNSSKSSVIHFNNRISNLNVQINSVRIPQVQEIKYLGRFISNNNSAIVHVNQIVKEVRKSCGFLRIINNCRTGLNPAKSLQLFRSLDRPKLEYAVSSFSNLSERAASKLKSLVNEILRKSLGLCNLSYGGRTSNQF